MKKKTSTAPALPVGGKTYTAAQCITELSNLTEWFKQGLHVARHNFRVALEPYTSKDEPAPSDAIAKAEQDEHAAIHDVYLGYVAAHDAWLAAHKEAVAREREARRFIVATDGTPARGGLRKGPKRRGDK